MVRRRETYKHTYRMVAKEKRKSQLKRSRWCNSPTLPLVSYIRDQPDDAVINNRKYHSIVFFFSLASTYPPVNLTPRSVQFLWRIILTHAFPNTQISSHVSSVWREESPSKRDPRCPRTRASPLDRTSKVKSLPWTPVCSVRPWSRAGRTWSGVAFRGFTCRMTGRYPSPRNTTKKVSKTTPISPCGLLLIN